MPRGNLFSMSFVPDVIFLYNCEKSSAMLHLIRVKMEAIII